MSPYKRPEKETDPKKAPGQIVNRPPSPDTLQRNIDEWDRYERSRNSICTVCGMSHAYPECEK